MLARHTALVSLFGVLLNLVSRQASFLEVMELFSLGCDRILRRKLDIISLSIRLCLAISDEAPGPLDDRVGFLLFFYLLLVRILLRLARFLDDLALFLQVLVEFFDVSHQI